MAILLLIGTVAVLAIGPGAEQFRVGPGAFGSKPQSRPTKTSITAVTNSWFPKIGATTTIPSAGTAYTASGGASPTGTGVQAAGLTPPRRETKVAGKMSITS